MKELVDLTRHPGTWTINVQKLILYVVAIVLFFAIHWGNLRVAAPLAEKAKNGKALALLPIFVLAAASSFFGVATLVVLAKRLGMVLPLALIALPLFLLLESHIRKLVASKDLVGFHLMGCAGVLLGMASSAYIWLRHNPLV